MIPLEEQYIVDADGQRQAVIVPWEQWRAVLEALEELDDIRAYDEAKARPSDPIPFEHALREIRDAS